MRLYSILSTLDVYGALEFAESYLRDIEEFVKVQAEKYKDIADTIDLKWAQKDVSDEDTYRKDRVHYKLALVKNYPNLLRSSLFVSLFSYLESTLMRECKQNQALQGDKFPEKKSTLDKIKIYFSKNLHSNYPFSTSREWGEIKRYQLVRHCLVHADGYLKLLKDEKKVDILKNFIAQNPKIIVLDENDGIFIEEGFCESFIDLTRTFLVDLIDVG